MDREDQDQGGDRVAPKVGGTSTPIAGSQDGTGEKDPVMSEEAGRSGGSPSEDKTKGE
jgi:hypothetical protein